VLVGRPFPPMTQHLRVSVGTQAEMDKFVAAFKEIMARRRKPQRGSSCRTSSVASRGSDRYDH
jgi:Histidinol-phosphate/aromatic aminotransferase and cobyric acid decarboxylase